MPGYSIGQTEIPSIILYPNSLQTRVLRQPTLLSETRSMCISVTLLWVNFCVEWCLTSMTLISIDVALLGLIIGRVRQAATTTSSRSALGNNKYFTDLTLLIRSVGTRAALCKRNLFPTRDNICSTTEASCTTRGARVVATNGRADA